MSNAIAVTPPSATSLVTFSECRNWAQAFAASGLFTDVRGEAQCLVKVAAGAEIGMPPFASMNGIHIINGKVSLGAGLIAAAIKRSCRYSYRVTKSTDKECLIVFTEKMGEQWEEIGDSSFTMQDAATATLLGNPTWKKYPKAMLYNRAISQGARMHTPDIFGGPIYTPEELGADIDENGDIVAPSEKPRPIRTVKAEVIDAATPEQQTEQQQTEQPEQAAAPAAKPPADPFVEHLFKICKEAWKAAQLSLTLMNTSAALCIEPIDCEQAYWAKGVFQIKRLNAEQLFRLGAYAKNGNALPCDTPITEALDALRGELGYATTDFNPFADDKAGTE